MESSVDFLYFHCFILFFPRLSQAGSPFLSTAPGQLPDTAPGLLPDTAPRHFLQPGAMHLRYEHTPVSLLRRSHGFGGLLRLLAECVLTTVCFPAAVFGPDITAVTLADMRLDIVF